MITITDSIMLFLILYINHVQQTFADISIQKYEFIGMRNVWHERDQYHEVNYIAFMEF